MSNKYNMKNNYLDVNRMEFSSISKIVIRNKKRNRISEIFIGEVVQADEAIRLVGVRPYRARCH